MTGDGLPDNWMEPRGNTGKDARDTRKAARWRAAQEEIRSILQEELAIKRGIVDLQHASGPRGTRLNGAPAGRSGGVVALHPLAQVQYVKDAPAPAGSATILDRSAPFHGYSVERPRPPSPVPDWQVSIDARARDIANRHLNYAAAVARVAAGQAPPATTPPASTAAQTTPPARGVTLTHTQAHHHNGAGTGKHSHDAGRHTHGDADNHAVWADPITLALAGGAVLLLVIVVAVFGALLSRRRRK